MNSAAPSPEEITPSSAAAASAAEASETLRWARAARSAGNPRASSPKYRSAERPVLRSCLAAWAACPISCALWPVARER